MGCVNGWCGCECAGSTNIPALHTREARQTRRSSRPTLRSSLELAGRISFSLYPLIAAAIASAMPVLPLVASMMVSPGLILPRASAALSMLRAGRSLAEPAGLWPSSLARMMLVVLPARCCSRTTGVLPTSCATVGNSATSAGSGRRVGAAGAGRDTRGLGVAAAGCAGAAARAYACRGRVRWVFGCA